MKNKPLRILMGLTALVFAALACNLPSRQSATPTPQPIPVSQEAADSLEATVIAAFEQAQSGEPVTVVLDETQITSYTAVFFAANPDLGLSAPQVFLRDGQVLVNAQYIQGPIKSPVEQALSLSTSAAGNIQASLTTVKLGSINAPDSMKESISAVVNQALSGSFGASATGLRITDVAVGSGTLTLTGVRQ